jgi:CRP-like cAMP-binding protein
MPSAVNDRALDPRRNQLLRALRADEYERVTATLEPVHLEVRDMVFDVNAPVDYLYFPVVGVLSQVAVLDGETAVEVSTIGREGMAGLPAFLGAVTSPNRMFCQVEADALRLPAGRLRELLDEGDQLLRVLHRYTQAMIVQIAQNVACNRLHSVEERAARWLLMTRDRVDDNTFTLTQDFLAQMLGVRRATVSITAGVLQTAGLIRYRRGQITIVDRDGLAETSCDCYRLVRDEFERLLGD